MKIKISATFEGKCSICKKKAIVFTAGDEDTKKTITICKNCTDEHANETTSEIIEKYGKPDIESFKEGIKISGKGQAS